MLEVRGLTVRYGSRPVVDGVSFALRPGQWLMIIGPNGAGKSTLVNALSGGAPAGGSVLFEGESLLAMKPGERARRLGVLMQSNHPGYAFTVEEVVRLGRYAWRGGLFGGEGAEDAAKVEAALADTGMAPLRGQSVLKLSGGELQRAFLAQLLAQDPRLMILDEPANHLDLVYQKQVFGLIRQWVGRSGRAAASVVHDLSLARAYGSHAMLMHEGKCVACGEINAVMTPEKLEQVYGTDVYAWMREKLEPWKQY